MTVWAWAWTTLAAATARSRLSLCVLTMNPDSSGLPNCCHQSGLGHTDPRPASCPTKAGGTMGGLRTWGTRVAQPTSSAVQAARLILFIAQRADGGRASHPNGVREDREPGDQQRHRSGGQEVQGTQGNAVPEAIQPV